MKKNSAKTFRLPSIDLSTIWDDHELVMALAEGGHCDADTERIKDFVRITKKLEPGVPIYCFVKGLDFGVLTHYLSKDTDLASIVDGDKFAIIADYELLGKFTSTAESKGYKAVESAPCRDIAGLIYKKRI